jgi:GT2 family glycosyltransferase
VGHPGLKAARVSDERLPRVSVVVPARGSVAEIRACLASLRRLDYPRSRHEIIVVDGSANGTAAILGDHRVRNITERRRGVAYARNAGIEASRSEVVAFTDTDCAVSTDWLREIVEPFGDPAVGCVGGAIVPYPPETSAQRYAARRMSHSQLRPMSHPARPFAMTPNAAFRREALVRVGGFDTRFPGGGWEDADLCWRLTREIGFRVCYAPRAVVFHRYRATGREFLDQHYRYGYGLGLLYRKYGDEFDRGWRQRVQGYTELAAGAWGCVRAATLGAVALEHRDEVARRWFDFLRALGQRSGVLSASLASRGRRDRRRPSPPRR